MADRPSQLSQDVAHAMNLFAHPMAGWAAASVVGAGLATQAWGLWLGAVVGTLENAGRLGYDLGHAGEQEQTVAALKARAAAVSLMAEAQSLAQEVAAPVSAPAGAAPRAAPAAQKPARSVAKQAARGTVRPAAVDRPAKPDDLKRLPGVGPKLEQVLNGLGVWTYAQIAGWSARDVAWVEDQLGLSGRVARDGWVAEAERLRAGFERKDE